MPSIIRSRRSDNSRTPCIPGYGEAKGASTPEYSIARRWSRVKVERSISGPHPRRNPAERTASSRVESGRTVLVAAPRPAVTDTIVADRSPHTVAFAYICMYRYRLTPVRVRTFVPENRSLSVSDERFSRLRPALHLTFPPSFRGSFNRLREPRSRFPARSRSLTLLPWETPARRSTVILRPRARCERKERRAPESPSASNLERDASRDETRSGSGSLGRKRGKRAGLSRFVRSSGCLIAEVFLISLLIHKSLWRIVNVRVIFI